VECRERHILIAFFNLLEEIILSRILKKHRWAVYVLGDQVRPVHVQMAVHGKDIAPATEPLIHDIDGRSVKEQFMERAPGG